MSLSPFSMTPAHLVVLEKMGVGIELKEKVGNIDYRQVRNECWLESIDSLRRRIRATYKGLRHNSRKDNEGHTPWLICRISTFCSEEASEESPLSAK